MPDTVMKSEKQEVIVSDPISQVKEDIQESLMEPIAAPVPEEFEMMPIQPKKKKEKLSDSEPDDNGFQVIFDRQKGSDQFYSD